jgi:ZIP family zinc transporter
LKGASDGDVFKAGKLLLNYVRHTLEVIMIAEAAFWGLIGASALVVGAEVAFAFRLSKMMIGLIMAFGVGALISSISFELVVPALETTSTARVSMGLLIGALVFFAGDMLIDRMGGEGRKDSDGPAEGSSGMGIVLGTVLDGIPESAVLGMSLASGDGVSVALLSAIWISNFPEALGATVGLEKAGAKRRNIRLMWWGIVLVSAVSAAVGYAVVSSSTGKTGAFVQAFAAGALLTMIADEMAPEAYSHAAKAAGLATALGFILAVILTTFE